jgi:isoquinoline 1-oxidoreductase
VTGKAKYAADIQLPACSTQNPAARHGATLTDVDLSEAKRVKGVQVLREGDFIAVLHSYPDAAELALSKVKAKFDKPRSDLDEKTIFDHLLKVAPEGTVLATEGNLKKGAQESSALFDQTYLNDYVAHAPMEPHAAVVHIEGKKATVWASTQTPFRVKEEVAKELGIPAENVGHAGLCGRRVRRQKHESPGR